jgi:hypothetical protein
MFERWRESLVADLADGTLCRGPAAQLGARQRYRAAWSLGKRVVRDNEKIGTLLPLHSASCVKGGASSFTQSRVEQIWEREITWFGAGLAVQNVPVTLPLHSSWQGGLAYPFCAVLEFVPSGGGDPLWIDELEEGAAYRLLISSPIGPLVRHDSNVLVGVAGFVGRCPILINIGEVSSDIGSYGERIGPTHVAAALSSVGLQGVRGFVYSMVEERLQIGLEGIGDARDLSRIDFALRQVHSGYDNLRSRGQLKALQLHYLPVGTLMRFNEEKYLTGIFGEVPDEHMVDSQRFERLCAGWS